MTALDRVSGQEALRSSKQGRMRRRRNRRTGTFALIENLLIARRNGWDREPASP